MINVGSVLQGRYRIVQRLGDGGMGTVYLAEDARLPGRRCAIKETSPTRLPPQERQEAIDLFTREAQMLATLSHPGLTPVTDFFSEGGCWYLVMDYVRGETLEARLERAGGRLSVDLALKVVRQLCKVLEFLHSQQPPVIFRDLKPGNIMLDVQNDVKLIDFGIARFFKPGQTRDTSNLGTPGYAAPEQYGGRGQSDPRTDVYSLGVLLAQMITGYNPALAEVPFPIPDPRQLWPQMPPHIAEVITRATRVQPNLRYASVAEMRQALFPPTYSLPPGPPYAETQAQPYGRTQVMPQQGSPQGGGGYYQQPSHPQDQGRGGGKMKVGAIVAAGILLLGLSVAAIFGVITFLNGDGPATPAPATSVPATDEPATVPPDPATATSPPDTSTASTGATSTSTTRPDPTSTPTAASASSELRLAFVRGNVGATDVYVSDSDGRSQTCVACRSCDEAEPAWSPDGSTVIYQADCNGSYDIWAVGVDTGATEPLRETSGTDEREPDWSPGGDEIVYRVNRDGSERNADGELRILSLGGGRERSLGEWGRSPVWSPDGRFIAFMSERSSGWEIYVHNLSSGSTEQITRCSANCRWPSWSPDSQWVIYHATEGSGSVTADTIIRTPASGGSSVEVVSGSHPGRPSWSSTGVIVFNSDRGLEQVNERGSNRRTLVSGESNWAPVWSK